MVRVGRRGSTVEDAMSYIGADPGATGALALYADGILLDVRDMPTYTAIVNKTERKRIDAHALIELFELWRMAGAHLALLEDVGGRKKQSAVNGFNFGFGAGVLYAALVAAQIPIDYVTAQRWKTVMRVPGKAGGGAEARQALSQIEHRAKECFPAQTQLFYGERGGKRIDRMEAALIAKYAADYHGGRSK